jgi:DNA-binding NtrC family response regulator
MMGKYFSRIGNECALDSSPRDFPPSSWTPESAKRNGMGSDKAEILTTASLKNGVQNNDAQHSGGPRVWRESVSPGMRTVEAVIRELSQNDLPVLVVAERGSGKAAAAARIHALSVRASQPFGVYQGRDVNEEILQACVAQGGTIYLQEVGDIAPAAQKVLASQISLNGEEHRTVPRFICGTSRELEPEVKAGKFREDLYYRISGVCLRLPPLRQRKEDIPILRDLFLSAAARDFCRPVPTLSADTQKFFLEHSWPGNIRELKDAARAIVALGDETLAMGGLRSLMRRVVPGGNGEKVSLKDAARAASREAEKEIILQALTRTRWNRRRAAQELQISYKALLYKLKQIGYEEYGA